MSKVLAKAKMVIILQHVHIKFKQCCMSVISQTWKKMNAILIPGKGFLLLLLSPINLVH